MQRGPLTHAAGRRIPSYFDWFTVATACLESLPLYNCALYPERKLSGVWKFGRWAISLQRSISVFLTDSNLAISNSPSIGTQKASYTKAFSRAIAPFQRTHQFQPCRSNCPMRIGGSSFISLTRMGQRPSKDTQTIISRRTG